MKVVYQECLNQHKSKRSGEWYMAMTICMMPKSVENIKRTNREAYSSLFSLLTLSLRWQMCCARHFESRIVMTLRSGKWEIKWTSICEFREHDKNVQVLFMIHVTCVWLFQSLSFSLFFYSIDDLEFTEHDSNFISLFTITNSPFFKLPYQPNFLNQSKAHVN